MGMTAAVNFASLDGLLARMGDAVGEAVRPAAQAAAQVFYDQVKDNVSRIGTKSGNLRDSIYQKFVPEMSVDGKKAVYRISWNYKKAPHGNLIEWGHFVRYKYYVTKDGIYRPMVRPERQGDPKPSRRASQAVKDAYYVPLAAPFRTTAYRFVQNAIARVPEARMAAIAEIQRRINDRMEGR